MFNAKKTLFNAHFVHTVYIIAMPLFPVFMKHWFLQSPSFWKAQSD